MPTEYYKHRVMRPKSDILHMTSFACRTPTLKKIFVCSSGKLDYDSDESFQSDSEDSCHFSPKIKVMWICLVDQNVYKSLSLCVVYVIRLYCLLTTKAS